MKTLTTSKVEQPFLWLSFVCVYFQIGTSGISSISENPQKTERASEGETYRNHHLFGSLKLLSFAQIFFFSVCEMFWFFLIGKYICSEAAVNFICNLKALIHLHFSRLDQAS